MILRKLPVACLLTLIAGAAAAQGTPRSVNECERLKNDLAYNQCLAMFGPEAKNVGGGDGGASSPTPAAAVSADAAAAAGIPSTDEPELAESGRRGRYYRRGGRQSVSFAVASADDGASRPSRYRHRRRH